MHRSSFKGFFIHPKLWKRVSRGEQDVKTWSRASTIFPQMVGMVCRVHNGRNHIPVLIQPDMVGCRLGEFVPTRLFKGHSGDKKGKK
jgi:small subunit ribosomal protein S19